VARQVAALGAEVSLAGVIGDDITGDDFLRLCDASHIDTRAIVRLPGRRTTRKLRVLGHSQQLLRLDWEDVKSCTPHDTAQLLAKLAAGRKPDAIILSDYAKGVLTPETIAAVIALRDESGVLSERVEELAARAETRRAQIRDWELRIEALRASASEAGESLLRLHGEQKQAEEALVHQNAALQKREVALTERVLRSKSHRAAADSVV